MTSFPFRTLSLCLLALLSSNLTSKVAAETELGAIIPGLQRSEITSDIKGLVLLEELNCVSCHSTDASFHGRSKVAPRLSDVGARIHPEFLEGFLFDPHETKPGTTMPDVMVAMGEEEKRKTAQELVHFLLSLTRNSFSVQAPDSVAAERGEQLFHSRGCVACHSPRDPEGKELLKDTSAPLGALHQKYSVASLADFLQNPLKVRPSGRMPNMQLQGKEAEQIAHYLLRDIEVPGSLNFTLYQGRVWEGLQSDSVEATRAGLVDNFDLESLGKVSHQTAIEYQGWIDIPSNGEYLFHLKMNGGFLRIDGRDVVAEEPSNRRGPKSLSGKITLAKGLREIVLTYFHTGREPSFSFEIEGQNLERTQIPAAMLTASREAVPAFEPFAVDQDLAKRGRLQFEKLGCANCHDDVGVPPRESNPFSSLRENKGCLAPDSSNAPRFSLTDIQLEWINGVLKQAETMDLDDQQKIGKTLVSFNCIGCHERSGVGAIDPARESYFTGSKPELGNQGRIPPVLSHVGAKLTPEWMGDVLLRGQRQRHYLDASMPQYGEANVGHLVEKFGKVDRLEDVELPEVTDILESKNAGYEMIGADGFSCIACHDYNGQEAGGAGALDIVHITDRIQKNWFHLYMRDPQRFHSTVIMPNYWPGGQSVRPNLLDGDTAKQIEALWNYLEDGPRAKKPRGLSRQSNEIRVSDVAEIVRGRGTAGFRGIGVGYPERINLAFDSEEMAVRLMWKGDFASVNHGSFRAIGEKKITFPPGIPFHRLESLDDDWPYKGKTDYLFPQDHGYQFRGYELDQLRRPTFRYQYGRISIEEFFEDRISENGDTAGNAWFRRVLRFDTPEAQDMFHFRAAAGSKVSRKSGGVFAVDQFELTIPSANEAIVRDGEPSEILIPLILPKGKSNLILEYRW